MVAKVCNGEHSFDISTEAAEKLKVVVQDAPNFLSAYPQGSSSDFVHTSSERTAGPGAGSSSAKSMSTGDALKQPSSQHHQATRREKETNAGQTPRGIVSDIERSTPSHFAITPSSRHVFLGVKCGDDYPIAHLQVDAMTDTEFFRSLRREYFRLRRWWRYCFYWWRYSHCEFYRVGYRILYQGQCR